MNSEIVVRKQIYAGLFMVTLSTLMYEILLTRIFSVTMWYHFAFLAISVAMFGMTVGAIIVYLLPGYFRPERVQYHLALSSFLFSISIILSFLTHLSIPFVVHKSLVGLFSIALNYTIISIPFIFSGICVTLALTRFPRQVSKLYAVDLAGASLGCILLLYVIQITGGPTGVFLISLLIAIGTLFFTTEKGMNKLRRSSIALCVILGVFVVGHSYLVYKQIPLLRLMWVKEKLEYRPLYEKWNSFSRIVVDGNPDTPVHPFGWGMSSILPPDKKVRRLYLDIDAGAGTHLTAFNGNLKKQDYLKYDVTNVAYYLRPSRKVLVVGTGGGRDILSALIFGAKSVIGVEINQDIINAVNRKFGDFTGHLDRIPGVQFVNDEARSYIARSKDKFDLIQISLIDTSAATVAGAYVLAENSLYTIEAWENFLDHLSPQGMVTYSRLYFKNMPAVMYRLAALATWTLKEMGVETPRDHIVIVRRMYQGESGKDPNGIGTLIASKSRFSEQELDNFERVVERMQFTMVLSPRFCMDPMFEKITSGKNLLEVTSSFPLNITPPSDDNPFFFNLLRLRDIFKKELWEQGRATFNMKAVVVLGVLLITVIVLTMLCIIVPLILRTKKTVFRGALPLSLVFIGIGMGFMLIEISQMQRLIIFLGHPSYSLSVVLFSLLLSCGLGSYSTQKIIYPGHRMRLIFRIIILICVLIIFGWITPSILRIFAAAVTPVRILVAVGILFPLGLFMGMPFPLGMKIASYRSAGLTPWLWGINGATSVCASVLAMVIALNSGITASFWAGVFCYIVAFISFIWASRLKTA